MTDKMIAAGVSAYLSNEDKDPKELVNLVWLAICDAKQKEALFKYWQGYE